MNPIVELLATAAKTLSDLDLVQMSAFFSDEIFHRALSKEQANEKKPRKPRKTKVADASKKRGRPKKKEEVA